MTTDKVKHCDCGEITCPHRADYLARLASKEIQHSPLMNEKNKTDKTNYVYIVHSVCPSFFASLKGAVKHAWAINSKPVFVEGMTDHQEIMAMRQSEADRNCYIATASKAVREHGVFHPDWQNTKIPQNKISRETLR